MKKWIAYYSESGITFCEEFDFENGSPTQSYKELDFIPDSKFHDEYEIDLVTLEITKKSDTVLSEQLLEIEKAKKIKDIDTKTALDIEALVGDNNKQKDKLALMGVYLRAEQNGDATATTSLNELQSLWDKVSALKVSGNNRELQVQNIVLADYASLNLALLAVEAI